MFIGFMGVGKTSVGNCVAKRIGYNFIDTDRELEKQYSMTIENMFSQYGENKFREMESQLIKKISNLNNIVISTGGGVVLNPDNINTLRQKGFIILLTASPNFIFDNISKEKNRPLLKVDNPFDRVNAMLEERKELYKNCDCEILTDELTIDEIAEEVISIIKEKNII